MARRMLRRNLTQCLKPVNGDRAIRMLGPQRRSRSEGALLYKAARKACGDAIVSMLPNSPHGFVRDPNGLNGPSLPAQPPERPADASRHAPGL
jgi:hypothetical protein